MSIKHVGWAFDQDISISGAKFVLVALANATSPETGTTFAGQKYLAAHTGQTDRTVRTHLAWLEQQGYISRQTRRRQNGSKTSDLITLNTNRKPLPQADQAENFDKTSGKFQPSSPEAVSAPYPLVDPAIYPSTAFKEDSLSVELGGQSLLEAGIGLSDGYYLLTQSDRALVDDYGRGDLWNQAQQIEAEQAGTGISWLVAAVRDAARAKEAA